MPLRKQLIIALVTGLVLGAVLMAVLDDPANAGEILGYGTSLGG